MRSAQRSARASPEVPAVAGSPLPARAFVPGRRDVVPGLVWATCTVMDGADHARRATKMSRGARSSVVTSVTRSAENPTWPNSSSQVALLKSPVKCVSCTTSTDPSEERSRNA